MQFSIASILWPDVIYVFMCYSYKHRLIFQQILHLGKTHFINTQESINDVFVFTFWEITVYGIQHRFILLIINIEYITFIILAQRNNDIFSLFSIISPFLVDWYRTCIHIHMSVWFSYIKMRTTNVLDWFPQVLPTQTSFFPFIV